MAKEMLGHTRCSNKPIYNSFEHPNHKDFGVGEHQDAAALHKQAMGQLKPSLSDYRKNGNDRDSDPIRKKFFYHKREYIKHCSQVSNILSLQNPHSPN